MQTHSFNLYNLYNGKTYSEGPVWLQSALDLEAWFRFCSLPQIPQVRKKLRLRRGDLLLGKLRCDAVLVQETFNTLHDLI